MRYGTGQQTGERRNSKTHSAKLDKSSTTGLGMIINHWMLFPLGGFAA
jgi:hypothetical protein